MRYLLRLRTDLHERMDKSLRNGAKSKFVVKALGRFLELPPQVLTDRPRFGDDGTYRQICVSLADDLVSQARELYDEKTPLAVVLQAAVARAFSEVDKALAANEKPKPYAAFLVGAQKAKPRIPTRTRIRTHHVKQLKQLADDPLYGMLRNVLDTAVAQFLESRPWEESTKVWRAPAADGTRGWQWFNVPLDPGLLNKVRTFASKREVSMVTVIHSAIVWWLNEYGPKHGVDLSVYA